MASLPEDDEPTGGGGDAEWLCTFNDLMTLLMVFFVLLFTMSSIPDPRFKNISTALQSGFGVLEAGNQVGVVVRPMDTTLNDAVRASEGADPAVSPTPQAPDTQAMAKTVVDALRETGDADGLSLGQEGQIRMGSSLLFETGQAAIGEEGGRMLTRLGEALRGLDCDVQIEGHTDNVPIETPLYPSNWELSAQRAVNVVKYLVEKAGIPPERLSAAGYGDAKPCATNETAEGREKNRRVEIVLVERSGHE